MSTQNCNFAHKFLSKYGACFQPKILHIWTKSFRQKENFLTILRHPEFSKRPTSRFLPLSQLRRLCSLTNEVMMLPSQQL